MDNALWIVAWILAAAYLVAGVGKAVVPKERLATTSASAWVNDFSARGVQTIGALEILAAIGLVLPALLDIAPFMVPIAAGGLVLLMSGAAITRLRRGERALVVVDLVYLGLAAFVVWGRFVSEPFTG